MISSSGRVAIAATCAILTLSERVRGASEADMVTPPGATATITVTLSVSTAFGSSSDGDTRTMAATGTADVILTPTAPPFSAVEFRAMQISFANTTFVFQLFCLPFIGCQTLNVNVNGLTFTAVEPFWDSITAGGNVSFTAIPFHATGSYSTSGLASDSGTIDTIGASDFAGRISSPMPGIVRFDQLALASQSIVVPPEQLPSGITALSFVIEPNLTNTTLQGPFLPLVPDFDNNQDGDVDWADHASLAGCLTGPAGGLATPGCAVHDADSDGDVDLLDAADSLTAFDP